MSGVPFERTGERLNGKSAAFCAVPGNKQFFLLALIYVVTNKNLRGYTKFKFNPV